MEQAPNNAVLNSVKRRGWEEDARRRQVEEEEESKRAMAAGDEAQEDNWISAEIMRRR